MRLQLHKPLIIFDLETTGVRVNHDRIIELFMIRISPNGNENTIYKRLNPGIPIPPESTAIHGISDADIEGCPTFADIASVLNQFSEGADFGGYNSNRFDFPMLVEEFYRAGIEFDVSKRKFIDAQRIFHLMEPRNLAAAYRFYCAKELENAHSAEADTRATWEILKAQLDKYPELPVTVEDLHKFSGQDNLVDLAGHIRKNNNGEVVFAFGKHKDKSVLDIFRKDPGYYDWMMQGDFPLHTKRIITMLRLQSKNV